MSVIEAINITKRFPGVVALENVSITLELGKIYCIVGENGAGKSTLIKILTGVYQPDEGSIFINGQNAILDPHLFDLVAYVPQELDLFRHMTVADNLFMPFEKSGINRKFIRKKEMESQALPWLERFQITAKPDHLVKEISISEQQMLQIARAMVHQRAQIILFDEPTTSLTTHETKKLFQVIRQLKEQGKAVVFISHKLDEVFEIGDEVIVLRNGVQVAHEMVNKVDIPWTINKMAGRELAQNLDYVSSAHTDDVLMEVEHLTGEKFFDVSFRLHKGEILGLSGLVGAGRSEVTQAIFGYLPVYSGSVTVGGKPWKFGDTNFSVSNGLIYLPEERKQQGILPFLGIRENLSISLLHLLKGYFGISKEKETTLSNEIVKAYNIKISSLSQLIMNLSGGNQQKVIIGRSMYCGPKVLIFDEPTKGIDVSTKAEIYRLMKEHAEQSGVGIILISSELEEILKCSNRVLAMYNGSVVGEFDGAAVNKKDILNAIIGVA